MQWKSLFVTWERKDAHRSFALISFLQPSLAEQENVTYKSKWKERKSEREIREKKRERRKRFTALQPRGNIGKKHQLQINHVWFTRGNKERLNFGWNVHSCVLPFSVLRGNCSMFFYAFFGSSSFFAACETLFECRWIHDSTWPVFLSLAAAGTIKAAAAFTHTRSTHEDCEWAPKKKEKVT